MEKALFHFNGRSMLCFPFKPHPRLPHALRPKSAAPPAAPTSTSTSTSTSRTAQSPYWDSINLRIATHLDKSIPAGAVPSVSEPLRRLALAAPRSSAPALCVAACELVGGSPDQALDAAAALHLVHAAAFLHDNLPLTDQPESRTGPRPTHHLGFGPNIELLTGDGMIPLALELLARSDNPARDNSDRVLRAMTEIMRAVGSQGAVFGRYCGSFAPSLDRRHLESWIDHVCEKREGGLHACGGACGAMMGGGTEEEIERLRAYGYCVGMVRGIIDEYGRRGREPGGDGDGNGNGDGELKRLVEEMRGMAVNNLREFDEAKAEKISSILWTY